MAAEVSETPQNIVWSGPRPIVWSGPRTTGTAGWSAGRPLATALGCGGIIADGAQRLAALGPPDGRGWSSVPPPIVCWSTRQLARELALAGEYARARQVLGRELLELGPGLSQALGLDASVAARIMGRQAFRPPQQPRKRRAARATVEACVALHRRCVEDGQTLTVDDLADALRGWLE